MKTERSQIHRIIQELQAGWAAGSGPQFAAAFAPQARFVVFDGTTLTGPLEIANFHQRAFDSQQGTALDIHIEEIRSVAPGVWLAWTKGGIRKPDGSFTERSGESVQLFVFQGASRHRSDRGIPEHQTASGDGCTLRRSMAAVRPTLEQSRKLNHETIDTGLAAQAVITDFAKTALSLVGQGIGVSDRA